MLQEYYFDKKYKNRFSSFLDEKFGQIVKYDDQGKKIRAVISVDGNNKKIAKKLHLLKENIQKSDIKIIYIYDESHIYFCNKLYPLVTQMEQRLKCIVVLCYSRAGKSIKKGFHDKNLFDYFQMLICDSEFKENVYKVLKDNKILTKNQLLEHIQNIPENPIYKQADLHLEETKIIDNFKDVKSFRNKIMHCKDFTYDEYCSAKNLIEDYSASLSRLQNRFTHSTRLSGLAQIMKNNASAYLEAQKKVLEAIRPSEDYFIELGKRLNTVIKLNLESVQPNISAIQNLANSLTSLGAIDGTLDADPDPDEDRELDDDCKGESHT